MPFWNSLHTHNYYSQKKLATKTHHLSHSSSYVHNIYNDFKTNKKLSTLNFSTNILSLTFFVLLPLLVLHTHTFRIFCHHITYCALMRRHKKCMTRGMPLYYKHNISYVCSKSTKKVKLIICS